MFKIGDRVRCLVDAPDGNRNIHIGDTGTVCDDSDGYAVRIRWDQNVKGHDCCGRCEYGYGWNVQGRELEHFWEEAEMEINEQEYMTVLLAH